MAKRRQNPKRKNKGFRSNRPRLSVLALSAPRGLHGEAVGVILGCGGLLTLLALASYSPADTSFNASGTSKVRNWIGPAGGYWADLLLQILGVAAFPFGAVLLLAAWKALRGRRMLPSIRQALGASILVVAVGTFAHLSMRGELQGYPPGGLIGGLLAEVIHQYLATVGSLTVSGSVILLGLALMADGMLAQLGLKLMAWACRVRVRVQALVVVVEERRSQLEARRQARVEREGKRAASSSGEASAMRDLEAEALHRDNIFSRARAFGVALGNRKADREEANSNSKETQVDSFVGEQFVDLEKESNFASVIAPYSEKDESGIDELDSQEIGLEEDEVESPSISSCRGGVATVASQQQVSTALIVLPKPTVSEVQGKKNVEVVAAPQIVDVRPPQADAKVVERAAKEADKESLKRNRRSFELPAVRLLDFKESDREQIDPHLLRENAEKLITTLNDFGIHGTIREIRPGPVVTMYEYVPAPGTKVAKISSLADDIAMAMKALRVRIVAPIPGKGAVGIEIPNQIREVVYIKEIVAHERFRRTTANLPIVLGKNIEGKVVVVDLAGMPHLLVAGATGSGKSVFVNSLIMSILFRASPEEVRFLMVDPKMLELSIYNGIPHLLLPVVTDPKKAAQALRWAVTEMEHRYELLSEIAVRNVDSYNTKVTEAAAKGMPLCHGKDGDGDRRTVLPYIVIIVDELADLMMVASREVEAYIMRLAQMARAAGLHLVLATQRPSVDVLTGVIKANFPTRVAFQVASRHDSRTILDNIGAENLLGRGDMLYQSAGIGGVSRIHGAFVNEDEIERTVEFLRAQGEPEYDESILVEAEGVMTSEEDVEPVDEMFDVAVEIVAKSRQASISMIQRRLRIGYNRAARIVEQMEHDGMVGPADGSKPREVLLPAPIE